MQTDEQRPIKKMGIRNSEMKDIYLTYYKVVRDEILFQLDIREKVLIFLLGSIGAILGITFRNVESPYYQFLLIIPWMSYGAGYLYFEHHIIIGGLVHYLNNEWSGKFKNFRTPFH